MPRLVNTIALAAAGTALSVGLWEGRSLLATGRRMVVAYLGFFFLGSILALLMRMVPLFEKPAPEPAPKGRRRAAPEQEQTAAGA